MNMAMDIRNIGYSAIFHLTTIESLKLSSESLLMSKNIPLNYVQPPYVRAKPTPRGLQGGCSEIDRPISCQSGHAGYPPVDLEYFELD